MVNITKKVHTIEIDDILKRLLEVKHITGGELSRRSGISRNQIYKILRGKTTMENMRLSTVHALSECLDVVPSIFMKAPFDVPEGSEEEGEEINE